MSEEFVNSYFDFLAWPVFQGAISQRFGEHDVDYSRYGLVGHNGVDIYVPEDPRPLVYASHAGQVWSYADPGYGNVVELWWPSRLNGIFKTIYAHLAEWRVADGQFVVASVPLGVMGRTGNSTGIHTHWGLKWLVGVNPGYRNWVDPLPFVEGVTGPLKTRTSLAR